MIDGKWYVWAKTPLGKQESILDLHCEEGGIMRGTVLNLKTDELVELKKGRWEGDHFSFRAQIEVQPLGKLAFVWEGDVLDLGGRELEIIHLPGHTPGSIAVLDRKYRALISGDPIQTGNIYMFGLHRDLPSYVASLERLTARMDEFDTIYPSHAAFPVSPDQIPALIADAKQVLNGEIEP